MNRHPWTRRRFLHGLGGLGASVAALPLLAACSDDDGDTATPLASTTTTSTPTDLPTNDEAELTRVFDPLFEPLDMHVTRIGLYDLSQGFVRDDAGTHLAIYVEPIDPEGEGWDLDRYVDNVAPVMAACTPYLFDTWAGIETMDICQEPPQAEAPEPEPPIVTQVQLDRDESATIDWESVTLADLFAARLRSPATSSIRAREDVEDHPRWVEAEEAAQDLV